MFPAADGSNGGRYATSCLANGTCQKLDHCDKREGGSRWSQKRAGIKGKEFRHVLDAVGRIEMRKAAPRLLLVVVHLGQDAPLLLLVFHARVIHEAVERLQLEGGRVANPCRHLQEEQQQR